MDINKNLNDLQKKCIDFMEKNGVSKFYINKWENFKCDNKYDSDDYDSIENLILGEVVDCKENSFFMKDDINIRLIVKKEIYKLLCAASNEYSEERNKMSDFIESIIPVISTSLASKLGMEIGITTGIVSIIVCGFLKLGKNVWCSCCKIEIEGGEDLND